LSFLRIAASGNEHNGDCRGSRYRDPRRDRTLRACRRIALMRRARIARLESVLAQPPARILGATIDTRTGKLRNILASDGVKRPAPPELTVEELPQDCLVHRYDPSQECAWLYRSTADGRCHVQRVLGVDEDVILGRDLSQKWQERETGR